MKTLIVIALLSLGSCNNESSSETKDTLRIDSTRGCCDTISVHHEHSKITK